MGPINGATGQCSDLKPFERCSILVPDLVEVYLFATWLCSGPRPGGSCHVFPVRVVTTVSLVVLRIRRPRRCAFLSGGGAKLMAGIKEKSEPKGYQNVPTRRQGMPKGDKENSKAPHAEQGRTS